MRAAVSPTTTPPPDLVVDADPAALGAAIAADVHAAIAVTRKASSLCLLGVPAGRTMAPVFTALADRLRHQPLPLDHLVLVMMDDYLVRRGTAWQLVPQDAAHSCRRFGVDVLAQLNATTDRPAPEGALWSPDPSDPAAYDEAIDASGGIELFLVAVGASDGHVAFNPPGTPLDSRTRVLEIAESTRHDNLATFPHLGTLDAVPTHGVSVGLGTIAASRRIVAALHGADKQQAVARLVAGSGFDPAFPASFLHEVDGATVHADAAAAGDLAPGGSR